MRQRTWLWIFGLMCSALPALADAPEGVAVSGAWLQPRVEARTRAELRRPYVEALQPTVPVLATLPATTADPNRAWLVNERARIGLTADRDVLSAAVLLQDSRQWGDGSEASTALHVAYAELHASDTRGTFARIGRQQVSWGDGRLLGVSDFSPTPRSLDAARLGLSIGIVDVEALASILSPPDTSGGGSGAQLYGVDVTAHIDPLLVAEIYGLARIARDPLPATLRPGDTYATSLRVHGEHDQWSYAAEGVLELGRVELFGAHRRLAAGAATARLGWEPDLALDPRLSLSGSYASGDDGRSAGTLHRFDPILPDDRAGLGQMGLYAWTNIVEAGAAAAVTPFENAAWSVGYRFVRLADPNGPWYAASLALIGQDGTGAGAALGHELDTALVYTAAPGLDLSLGYGALFAGAKARAIVPVRVMHGAYAQASLVMP